MPEYIAGGYCFSVSIPQVSIKPFAHRKQQGYLPPLFLAACLHYWEYRKTPLQIPPFLPAGIRKPAAQRNILLISVYSFFFLLALDYCGIIK
jgi:hypothetical protein